MTFPLAFDPTLFWVLFGLTVLVMVALRRINKPLTNDEAPSGIVSLQLAGLEKAKEILDSWDGTTRLHAVMGIGFDYLFLALYGTSIALGCAWSGGELAAHNTLAGDIGPWLAWAAWLAALLDAVENVALWRMVRDGVSEPWPTISRWCARPKIVILVVALLYVLTGVGFALFA